MTDILDKLKNFNQGLRKQAKIEELDIVYYYTPLTYGEMLKIQELSNGDDLKLQYNMIIEKCRDEGNKKIFDAGCISELEKLPLTIVNKIVATISYTEDSTDDIKKN